MEWGAVGWVGRWWSGCWLLPHALAFGAHSLDAERMGAVLVSLSAAGNWSFVLWQQVDYIRLPLLSDAVVAAAEDAY